MKAKTNARTMKMVQMALLTAIILLLAFTPIGFIKLPAGLSITIIGVPVIIGAITWTGRRCRPGRGIRTVELCPGIWP